jgi:Sjoegren syndrome nuclear autoantigen 1
VPAIATGGRVCCVRAQVLSRSLTDPGHAAAAAPCRPTENFNNELVRCIEDLREKREEVNRQILKDEEEKAKIQKDLSILTDRLGKINESLLKRQQARNEYDRTIGETEAAYMKILESSHTLLNVLRRESLTLGKKKQTSS